jgi:peptide/nickel transport system substrate-binding protein
MAIPRRSILTGAAAIGLAASLKAPAIAQPARVIKFIPSTDLAGIDPIWTTG